jgi:hypothetical protein
MKYLTFNATFALAATAIALVACGDDGVPNVADPHAIVVDGKPMNQSDFIKNYCRDKISNKTCMAVRDAKSKDDGRRPVVRGW